MADINESFEHRAIETDIINLAESIKQHRDRPEARNLSEKDFIKEALKSVATSTPSSSTLPDDESPLPRYVQDAPDEERLEIEYLLDMAFHKGIVEATREAKKTSPFVLDAFHDALAGRLYPELKKRGIVK